MVTTTVYKGRLSTRPGARLVTLTNSEYERLLALESAEEQALLEARATVRFTPADMRRIMEEAGWREVRPPKRKSTLPAFLAFPVAGFLLGLAIVLLFRWMGWR